MFEEFCRKYHGNFCHIQWHLCTPSAVGATARSGAPQLIAAFDDETPLNDAVMIIHRHIM